MTALVIMMGTACVLAGACIVRFGHMLADTHLKVTSILNHIEKDNAPQNQGGN